MWLLDVNLPHGLQGLLQKLGIQSDITVHRGWQNLENGALAKTAFEAGFLAILTRDRLFGESASRALSKFPQFAVVILNIPQARESKYLTEFEKHWNQSPIEIRPGQVLEWPKIP